MWEQRGEGWNFLGSRKTVSLLSAFRILVLLPPSLTWRNPSAQLKICVCVGREDGEDLLFTSRLSL